MTDIKLNDNDYNFATHCGLGDNYKILGLISTGRYLKQNGVMFSDMLKAVKVAEIVVEQFDNPTALKTVLTNHPAPYLKLTPSTLEAHHDTPAYYVAAHINERYDVQLMGFATQGMVDRYQTISDPDSGAVLIPYKELYPMDDILTAAAPARIKGGEG